MNDDEKALLSIVQSSLAATAILYQLMSILEVPNGMPLVDRAKQVMEELRWYKTNGVSGVKNGREVL